MKENMQERKTATFVYTLIRARRKTMSLKVNRDGSLTVRAPYRVPVQTADLFVENHKKWIQEKLLENERQERLRPVYTDEERAAGKALAAKILGEKCRQFAGMMGVDYGHITIREQKTRWGSCSTRGNLNFNWKLVLMPERIQDYLVVHELAHRLEMNHSAAFWAVVERILPDYRERQRWLRENGRYY